MRTKHSILVDQGDPRREVVAGQPTKKSRVLVALVSLHVMAAFMLFAIPVAGLLDFIGGSYDPYTAGIAAHYAVLCGIIAGCIELVAYAIHRRWLLGWVAGFILFVFWLPLGAIGLWGLLAKGSRAEFRFLNSSDTIPRHGA